MSSLHKYSKVYLAKKPIPKLYVGDEDSEESEDDLKTTVESAEKIQDTIIASYYRFRNQKRQQIREQTQSQESCWQTFTLNRKAVVNEDNRVVVNEVKTQLPEQEDHLDTGDDLLDTGDAAATLNLEHSIGDEDFIDYEETAGQESIVYRLKLREPRPLVGIVKNMISGVDYRFNIKNLMKPKCLYSEGMKTLMYSEKLSKNHSKGWFREGKDISYTCNDQDAKGFIEFILGETMEAKFLRDNYVIKLIPMINPDGVIVGNHRCNLNGYDLNRQWKVQEKSKNIVPEVWLVKQMIKRTLETREIAMYCDFHGHNCVEKVFPLMLSKAEPDLFFFKRCQFRLQKRKEGTSRFKIVLFKEFNILNSFTLEASFCGSDINGNEFHFNLEHLHRMGSSIGKTFYQYFSDGETVDKCRHEVTDAIEKGNNEYIAEESESEDTTSDDELLRKRAAKKKKQKSKPKVSSPASSRPSTASRSKPIPTVLYKNTGDSTVERPTIQSRPSTPRPNSRQTSIASLQKPAGTLKVQNMSPGVSRSEPDLRNSARGSMIKSQARNSLPGRLNAVLARHANSVTYIPIVSITDFNVNVRPVTSECSFPVGVKSKPNRKPSLTSCSKCGFCGGDTKSCLK
ncbi:Cytosolic carboxypeptidase 2 [Globomyces sp. JEL0801]|nr:Cytosolic carboxypeptidase 2 [Globomyces sp. JEL0801]